MGTEDNNQGETRWNNHDQTKRDHENYNEGFSSENIPADYDPAKESGELLKETETDEEGNRLEVNRARFPDDAPQQNLGTPLAPDNRIIENSESLQNRDLNYDFDPERYDEDHPDNHRSRGNINFGE